MEDTMEKIGKILSDEESVRQLTELAQILMNDNKNNNNNNNNSNGSNDCDNNNSINNNGNMPDIAKMMQLTELMGNFSQNDKNTELLMALKPHLKEERQIKVDKAVKMLKLMTVWNTAKESGLLNDII
ncbi:MAG: hypothetical protein K2J36_06155 [Ruminococcus sp.]|nr:hypothetical protein [Ruminococcus sp.]